MMNKKEYYLDYNRKSKKRKFYGRREMKDKFSKKSIAFFILLFATMVGTGVTLIMMYQEEHKNKNQDLVQNPMISKPLKELAQTSTYGPYGMWISNPVEEEIIAPEETKEAWMADFVDKRTTIQAKGIYVTASKANSTIDDLIQLVDETELNTMVIDIKDDKGNITYKMNTKTAVEINAPRNYIQDIEGLIKRLKEKDIYLIARVVAFKDPVLADAKPELALWKKDGTIFRDKDNLAWVNPYKKEVWDYLIEVASQCADLGFDEVNFDYIRFSTDSGMSDVDFGKEAETKTKIETITEFVKYACEHLKPLGIFVSADVYGAIISSSVDAKIVGQSYVEMSKYLDYICPMIYPSHYGDGYYGIDYPDTQPYKLIYGALESSRTALAQINEGEHRAIVRPWLQDFTASWLSHYIKYGSKEVREQIEAVYDSNYDQWLLWNGGMNYSEGALYTEEEAVMKYNNRPTPTLAPTPTPEPLPTRVPNSGQYYESPWKND
jgi:hypothetical protein